MITVDRAKELIVAGKVAEQHIAKIDALIETNAVAGWTKPVHFPVASLAIGRALERIYAAGGWYVETSIEERDRIGQEQTITFILGFPT